MKRGAAFVAFVVGLLGMAWWLWPDFRWDAPQRLVIAAQPHALPLTKASANPAIEPATTPDPGNPHSDSQRGSCQAWYASLTNPPEDKALQAAWLGAQAQGEAQLNQLLRRLVQTGTPGERAAALYLKVEGQAKQVSLDFFDKNPECRAEYQCDIALGKAGRESDTAEAIYRFSQAKADDNGLSLLSDLARSDALTSDIPFVTSEAVDRAFQGHIQAQLPSYQVVMAHCTLATVRDANRAQVCNDVADRLFRDGTVLLAPALAFRLGERLAWPAPRLAAIKEELDALRALQLEASQSL